jgi:hypothetical protein
MQLFASFVQTGTTALFFAAQGGYLDIAQLLLDRRVPVDAPSVVGRQASGWNATLYRQI